MSRWSETVKQFGIVRCEVCRDDPCGRLWAGVIADVLPAAEKSEAISRKCPD